MMKSYMNSYYEFRYEFMIMKNIVKSFEGKYFTHKVVTTASFQSAHCKPYGCCVAAARWQPGGAAATANVGCCAQQSREDVEGLVST